MTVCDEKRKAGDTLAEKPASVTSAATTKKNNFNAHWRTTCAFLLGAACHKEAYMHREGRGSNFLDPAQPDPQVK